MPAISQVTVQSGYVLVTVAIPVSEMLETMTPHELSMQLAAQATALSRSEGAWFIWHGVFIDRTEDDIKYGLINMDKKKILDTALQLYKSRVSPYQKVAAIKMTREITGMGLKEAKDYVEANIEPIVTRVLNNT